MLISTLQAPQNKSTNVLILEGNNEGIFLIIYLFTATVIDWTLYLLYNFGPPLIILLFY